MSLTSKYILFTTGPLLVVAVAFSYQRTVLFYATTLLVLSVSLAVITALLVNRPIKGIIQTMKQAEGGDLDARFLTGRRDEIGALSESLNSMLVKFNKTGQALESCHAETTQKVQRMATIGELAAAIGHEIKNPLAGISGAIQVFEEDLPPGDPRKDIIKEVLGEIARLDSAVKELLSFAHPPEPLFITTPVALVIDRAVKLVEGQAKKQDVDVNIIATANIAGCRLDPEQMQQVFFNVMINALHSMPVGGILTVVTRPAPDRGFAEISISDTGRGIDPGKIKDIFKPFFTTKHTGSGLGLAISKNIVEKHGGTIVVESEPGSGSNFRIMLPLETENA